MIGLLVLYFFCMFTYFLMVFSGELFAFNYNYFNNHVDIQSFLQEIEKVKYIAKILSSQQPKSYIIGIPFAIQPYNNFDILTHAMKYPEVILWSLNIVAIVAWTVIFAGSYYGYKSYLEEKRANLI